MRTLTASPRPIIVGVGGFTSEVGKTTLVCDLLGAFQGWEAIKMTRGHYRSCGKAPHSCCVSDLLGDEALIRSGRHSTYSPGKDTARYWDAGAANVHWVIATDGQVEEGIKNAIGRVQAPGVFVEGNSFTKFVEADFFIMVVRTDDLRIKTTAREALSRVSAFYVSGEACDKESLKAFLTKPNLAVEGSESRTFMHHELPRIIARIAEKNPRPPHDFEQPALSELRLKLPQNEAPEAIFNRGTGLLKRG